MSNSKTTWQFYTSSDSAWEGIIAALNEAKHTIDLEEFILHDDAVGRRVLDCVVAKATQGVKVRLLIDWLGSHHTYLPFDDNAIREKGVKLVFFNPPTPWSSRHKTLSYYRDHNKVIVIDGRVGFTGGICISEHMEGWRDTTVQIEGPVVAQMQDAFTFMWEHTAQTIRGRRKIDEPPEAQGFRFLRNIPRSSMRHLMREFYDAIKNAKHEILITNPYFAPTRRLFKLLIAKRRAGVEVSIITPQSPDSKLVKYAAQSYITHALRAGIRVFYQHDPINHSKTMVIDGIWASVGSMNFDHISLVYNFEGNLVSTNGAFAHDVKMLFEADKGKSDELILSAWNRRPLHDRFLAWLIRPIRSWL